MLTAMGDHRIGRVTALGFGVVYVTNDEEYKLARTEGREPQLIVGFPTEDVELRAPKTH